MRNPISTLTNIFYVAVAVISPFAVAGPIFLLGLSSAAFHATEGNERIAYKIRWALQKADEISMFLAFWFLIGFLLAGGPWTWMAVVGVSIAMALMHDYFDRYAVGLLFIFTLVIKISLIGPAALYSLIPFGAAYAVRQYGEYRAMNGDLMHGCWHGGTSFGIYLLIFL